jgi:putative peptidoglycan lipid II flippase
VTGGATQINLLVGQMIASAQDGAIALLNYADRINQLPLGVIGIAIGVVLLPELSRALKAGKAEEAAHLQNRSLEFALGITVPATVGLMVMPTPIINILYERGAFTPETTAMTASALAAFASGLPAYVMIKVFQPAYFAREDMKTPMRFALVQVVINIALSLALFPYFGHVAIALSTSVSAWVNAFLLAMALWRGDRFRLAAATVSNLGKILLAAAVMGLIVWFSLRIGAGSIGHDLFVVRAAATILVIAAAAAAYFAIVILTGALDGRRLVQVLLRRRPTGSA